MTTESATMSAPFFEPPPTVKVKLRPKHIKFIRAEAKETFCTVRVHEFHATQFNVNNDIVGYWEVKAMPYDMRRVVYTFTPTRPQKFTRTITFNQTPP